MSNKTPEMEAFLDRMAVEAWGRHRTGDQCVCCGSKSVKPSDFKDALSRTEFGISHMCQKCQDDTFGAPEL